VEVVCILFLKLLALTIRVTLTFNCTARFCGLLSLSLCNFAYILFQGESMQTYWLEGREGMPQFDLTNEDD